MAQRRSAVLAPRARRRGAREAARRGALHPGHASTTLGLRDAERDARRVRQGRRAADEPLLLPVDRPDLLPGHRRPARRAQAVPSRGRRRAGRDREAVRHDAGRGRAAQPRRAVGPRRAAGLSHRPLPGQGDRPEHDGVPVRQRALRAGVEPQLHRPHRDHGRRGHRHRHPGRVLRQRRRSARPHPEPHAPAAVPRGHGAAGELHRRRGPQREGQGPAGDPRAHAGGDSRDRGPRPVRRGRVRRRARGGLSAGGGRPGRLQHRDLRRPAPGGRQLALGRRALLPAHRQAPGAQGHRDRGDPEAGAAPGVQAGGLARRAPQPADPHHAAQRGRLAVARRQDPRHADAHPPRLHGVPLRHLVPVAVARGLRATDHGRHARRRHALHPQRRGRGAVAHLRPDRAGVGGHAGPAAAVPVRLAGARGGSSR